ncbi:Mitochondrial carrier protein [Phaffia rhodozyma]|uniref:Mitochondrial carrier protein n=1 Tax=Phaffia rhodozyma TaxID=264483 RepID=A0A0F7SM60_PHARH|nr:Mitochondrial carrier protein [Phaffia rhodozyma]
MVEKSVNHPRPVLDFFAGTAGGVAGVVVGHPFDTVKVRFQNPAFSGQYTSTFAALRLIAKKEKFRGLYRGVVSPIIGVAPVNGLIFASFKYTMSLIAPPLTEGQTRTPNLTSYLVAGCVSGIVASTINAPTELVKIKQQSFTTSHPPSTVSIARDIFKRSGIKGLYRGFQSCWLRDLGYGPYFWTYEVILRAVSPTKLHTDHDLMTQTEEELEEDTRGWWAVPLAGGLAGVVSWTTTFPLDVVKTRLQAASSSKRLPNGELNPYRTTLSTIKHSYAREGWKVFYRGLGPTLIRAVPTNIVTFSIFEACFKMF